MTNNRRLMAGRVLSSIAVLFLVFDASGKLLKLQPVLDATAQLGFPQGSVVFIGILLLACTVVYAVPRTTVLGAVLLTGYLGGAVAAHVRVGNPTFETLFPVIVGTLLWAGVVLRDRRVGALVGPTKALAG